MNPFLGEIRMFAFPWAPKDWTTCDGQILQMSEKAALASLLGNQFGGNLGTTFKLPDLRGRVPIGSDPSSAMPQGRNVGMETVTLTQSEMAMHTHEFQATTDDGELLNSNLGNCYLASVINRGTSDPGVDLYGNATDLVQLAEGIVTTSGGSQSHNNLQPSTVVNFCISLDGYYPTRN